MDFDIVDHDTDSDCGVEENTLNTQTQNTVLKPQGSTTDLKLMNKLSDPDNHVIEFQASDIQNQSCLEIRIEPTQTQATNENISEPKNESLKTVFLVLLDDEPVSFALSHAEAKEQCLKLLSRQHLDYIVETDKTESTFVLSSVNRFCVMSFETVQSVAKIKQINRKFVN